MSFSAPSPWAPQHWTDFMQVAGWEELRTARRAFLVAGILGIVTGVAAIAVPIVASVATAIFIGWILVASSVWMFVDAIGRRVAHSRGELALRLLNAVLTLFVGIWLLVAPLSGTLTLTFMLAAWFLAVGGLEMVAAWRERHTREAPTVAIAGALSLVLGLLIAWNLPSSAAWALGLLVGVELVLWGSRSLALSFMLREPRPR
ncbi:MAG: hypothetical protein QOF86_818 [Baekduia sp.]|jgi:uncharacterized membrane protein HdeD (DUF308 family)|nr:hypothetical protein [Baekduia sp.]